MKSPESIIRSLFISVFPFTALLVLAYSFFQFYALGFYWSASGMLLTAAPIVLLFAGLFIKPRARTTANLKYYSLAITIGVLISFISLLITKASPLEIALSIILGIGWISYLKWYSVYKNRTNEGLKVGNQLAEFQLENSEKEKISAASFLGSPSIFLFYRGNWCPLCMAQIKEITSHYAALDKLGVQTVLISPQPHRLTKSLAVKYNLNFHFLVDHKNKVAKQLGIFAENGIPAGFQVLGYDSDTVMPTLVITNKEGKIIFADLTDNYRLRPEPEVFLEIIRNSTQQPHLPNS